jgi:hypothetical protein
MNFNLRAPITGEYVGTGVLVAAVMGSGIMGERLAAGKRCNRDGRHGFGRSHSEVLHISLVRILIRLLRSPMQLSVVFLGLLTPSGTV